MYLQVDIYQCDSKHIHVVLQGRVQGEAIFGDFDAFAAFIEACQQFINTHSPIPRAFQDAFDGEVNP